MAFTFLLDVYTDPKYKQLRKLKQAFILLCMTGNYKPGVLSSGDDDFELGVSRLKRQQQTPAEESIGQQETGGELQAKPASHEETSVYSQVSSSDLLF